MFILFLIALCLYLVSTIFYLLFLAIDKKGIEALGHFSLLSGFIVHFISTCFRYFQAGYTPITNLHESLSFLSLCMAGFFLFLKRSYKISILGSIIVPFLSLVFIWALWLPSDIKPLTPILQSTGFQCTLYLPSSEIQFFLSASSCPFFTCLWREGLKEKNFRPSPPGFLPWRYLIRLIIDVCHTVFLF